MCSVLQGAIHPASPAADCHDTNSLNWCPSDDPQSGAAAGARWMVRKKVIGQKQKVADWASKRLRCLLYDDRNYRKTSRNIEFI